MHRFRNVLKMSDIIKIWTCKCKGTENKETKFLYCIFIIRIFLLRTLSDNENKNWQFLQYQQNQKKKFTSKHWTQTKLRHITFYLQQWYRFKQTIKKTCTDLWYIYKKYFLFILGTINLNKKDYYGKTPLYWAAYKGHKACLEELLKFGASVNTKCRHGGSPLHAVVSLYPECALLLIKVGSRSYNNKDC